MLETKQKLIDVQSGEQKYTSEELEKLLGTLKKEYKHEGSFRSMRDHSRANLIFGKDANETKRKREEFLLKQAEIQEKEKLLKHFVILNKVNHLILIMIMNIW